MRNMCLILTVLLLAVANTSSAQQNHPACQIAIRDFVVPRYPALARQTKVQGTVSATVNVDTDGHVAGIADITGPPPLTPTVAEALRHWTFEACKTPFQHTLRFHFVLVGPTSERNITTRVSGQFPDSLTIEARLPVEPGPDVSTNPSDNSDNKKQVDGALVDLSRGMEQNVSISFISVHSKKGLEILRHSASHVMAQAVKDIFPTVKLTFGPSTETGFYYDFDYDRPFTPQDLEKIEKRMAEIVEKDLPFVRQEVSKEEAAKTFKDMGETYKVEHLEELPGRVSLYRQGTFLDLCEGPHIPSTGKIKAFKLLNVSGTYWRGDARNQVLQRIYGTAFPEPEALEEYLHMLEEARKRDHRRLGRELDLFSIHDEAGPGLVIYHPKGAMLRTILEDFERREHLKRGYQIVIGPQLLRLELWKRSGHFENYRDKMYFTKVEDDEYGIKPMNCLAHMLIYKSQIRSYRDLPFRYFELGTVHRHEKSGELHGLLRVRGFTQDDAHILCRPDQLNDEICAIIDFIDDVMKIFGFEYEMELSTRPEKSIGADEDWARATDALLYALKARNLSFEINEGEGAFYGPKIDVKLKDALSRRWQCATIQVDFAMPERFDLAYVGSDGERHRPVMLHRVILGAMERFIGVLIEHYAGAFPVWLAPVQAILLTVTERHIAYAEGVYQQLIEKGLRVERDFRNEKLGFKIREAQLQKIPYMLVIGDREEKEGTLSPRQRSGVAMKAIGVEDFINQVESEYPSLQKKTLSG